jgi:phosphoribosylanthranilate isomerase
VIVSDSSTSGKLTTVLIQIYGLTTVSDAMEVDRLGADHLGVVVDEGIDTWDSIDEGTATAIASRVEHGRLVALSLSTDPERISATAALLNPAVVHLARADQIATDTLARIRDALAPVQHLLLDTSHPSTGVVGASGLVHDWGVSARIVAGAQCPVILAGGLGPDNVSDAIARVRPDGVDS